MSGAGDSTRILVATDFSPCGERAAEVALDWAGNFDAELHWAHATERLHADMRPSSEPLLASYVERAHQVANEKLRGWTGRAGDRGLETAEHVAEGEPAECIVRLASELDVDAVIVGSHGHGGFKRLWLGSVAERVARDAACSVLVVRGDVSPAQPGSVVLGDDLTPYSQPARKAAFMLASRSGAKLEVVHSLDLGIPYLSSVEVAVPTELFSEVYEEASKRLVEEASGQPGVEIENCVVSERPAAALCERAETTNAGLIVVGTHSRKGVDHALLGSVAERVVRAAPCSVLVTRPRVPNS